MNRSLLVFAFATASAMAACGTSNSWDDVTITDTSVEVASDVVAADAMNDATDVAADRAIVDASLDAPVDAADAHPNDASPPDVSPIDVRDVAIDVPTSCPAGFADCNGLASDGCEVNTLTDPSHCGSCSNACGTGSICGGGTCASSTCGSECNACCPGGLCNGGLRCAAGACQPPTYDGGPPLC